MAAACFSTDNKSWEHTDPQQVGLNSVALAAALDFAISRQSSSVVILLNGRIIAERHQHVNSPDRRY